MDSIKKRAAAYVCRSCTQRGLRARSQQSRRTYSTGTQQPDIYDVVCVGGGPAGLSLLTALRRSCASNCPVPYYLPGVYADLTRSFRGEPRHIAPPRRPRRGTGSLQDQNVEAPARQVLEPMQLPDPLLRPLPRPDRRLEAS